MRLIIKTLLTLAFAIVLFAIGYYLWPLFVGMGLAYQGVRLYRHFTARRAPKWVTRARARLTYER